MSWLLKYRIRHYVVNAIWILPFVSMLLAMIAIRVIYRLDRALGWESPMQAETARAVLGTLAASMFTFIVFVSSALLVAVQLASAQLTPRIIAIVFRSPVTRWSLSLFVFTFTFTVAALIRISDVVPYLTVHIVAYGCVLSVAVFLLLIDHVGKSLRPSGALRTVALLGHKVIKSVYPQRLTDEPTANDSEITSLAGSVPRAIIENDNDGVVLAFDVVGLANVARKHNCLIEMVPQVGDHIAAGDPLLRVFGGEAALRDMELHTSVAIGVERTFEQDPTFPFRIMVDIASKGLSPAINDPTTAVLAIDQIHYLLRYVGGRNLNTGMVRDSAGTIRLVYRTPDWEDFVRLAITEIRHFGGDSIQVARRLRAMLENLIQSLPESRAALLRRELDMLHRAADRCFSEPDDRAYAEISDPQGVGGKRPRR